MVQYAELACDRCFAIYPGNVLSRVTDRVQTGQSIQSDRYGHELGSTSHFGSTSYLLCPKCLRRRRKKQIVGLSIQIVGLSIVGIVGFTVLHGGNRSHPVPNNAVASGEGIPPLDRSGQGAISPELVSEGGRASAVSLSSQEQALRENDEIEGASVSQSSVQEAERTEETAQRPLAIFEPAKAPELNESIKKAVLSGKAERWQHGEFSGYAVPSETADPKGCRSVFYTLDQRSDWRSEPLTKCP